MYVCTCVGGLVTNSCAFLGCYQVESVVPWLQMVLQLLREAQQITLDFMDKVSLLSHFLSPICSPMVVHCTQGWVYICILHSFLDLSTVNSLCLTCVLTSFLFCTLGKCAELKGSTNSNTQKIHYLTDISQYCITGNCRCFKNWAGRGGFCQTQNFINNMYI